MPNSPTADSSINKSQSADVVNEQEKRIEEEIEQLKVDIQRIGGGDECKFGALFDDDEVANYYEALIGTLKAAKKRKVIDFKGQMLLKGVHDDVVISLVKN